MAEEDVNAALAGGVVVVEAAVVDEEVERILMAVPGIIEMIDPALVPHVSWPGPPHQKLVGLSDPVPELHGYMFAQKGFSMKMSRSAGD